VIGNGSFGVVYQATVLETQETVAIKKVLQDRRFKNRELQIMSSLNHPNIVALKHCFFSRGERDDVFLNLVMEYIPETLHRTLRVHTRARRLIPALHTKVYIYQLCRSLAYIHSLGICHRDIKPQNLLLNARTHELKLCDFGSAKVLVPGEMNVSYICSRYYRAPELVFEAVEYTTAVDIWSLGCVFAELLLGTPLFPGDSGLEQLIEIIRVLGTPTREEIYAMNPDHRSYRFPQLTAHNWTRIFRDRAPPDAVDLVSQFLRYTPSARLHPMDALAHPYFDELRDPSVRLLNGRLLPNIHNWLDCELEMMKARGLMDALIPPYIRAQMTSDGRMPEILVLDPNNPQTTTVRLGPHGQVTFLQCNPDGTFAPVPPPAPATTSSADVLAHSNPSQVPLTSIPVPTVPANTAQQVIESAGIGQAHAQAHAQMHSHSHQAAPPAAAAASHAYGHVQAPLPIAASSSIPLPVQTQQQYTQPQQPQQQQGQYGQGSGIGRAAGSDRMYDPSSTHSNNPATRSQW